MQQQKKYPPVQRIDCAKNMSEDYEQSMLTHPHKYIRTLYAENHKYIILEVDIKIISII